MKKKNTVYILQRMADAVWKDNTYKDTEQNYRI